MAISLKSIQRGSDRTKPPMLLVYGTPGIGKTTFGASAPAPKPDKPSIKVEVKQ